MAIKCCYGCVPPKRHTACHGHCPEYIAEKAEEDEKKRLLREKKALDRAINEQRENRVRKCVKGRK